MKTVNFRLDITIPENDFELKLVDRRNGIICFNPTFDFDCYFNYIKLLNGVRDKWTNYSLLDYGLIPVWMAPSFLHSILGEKIVDLLNLKNVPFYLLDSTSLLGEPGINIIQEKDIWVKRSDAARLMGIQENQVNTEDFVRWCLDEFN